MWCPKCKNEYREGITVCADCNTPLVEELTYEEESDDTVLDEADQIVFDDEAINMDMTDEEIAEALESARKSRTDVKVYESMRSKYEDNKSSAITLLLVGGIGLIVVILHAVGIIDFNLTQTSKIIITTVMGLLFTIFIVSGIASMKNAKKYRSQADEEEALTANILDTILDKYDCRKLDEDANVSEGDTNYDAWKKRYDVITNDINEAYPNLLEEYVDYIAGQIYTKLYGEETIEELQ